MASTIAYGSTFISANAFPGILINGGREIATAAVYIDPANPASYSARVELKASIGFYSQNFALPPSVNVYILRHGIIIYSGVTQFPIKPVFTIVDVLAVDGAIPGLQNYQLAVDTLFSEVFVKGPIAFTATVIGL